MIFNSLTFAIFFTLVLAVYWFLDHKRQNRMLLVASYYFYGSWDWRFLSLIFASTVFDYCAGRWIANAKGPRARKLFLASSVAVNLGFLGFFKYYNFFTDNLVLLLERFGMHASVPVLNIILPVGISFYTFQSMSYTIGVYRGELKPVRGFLDFALYVAFFPQLMAGPIERAKHLVPQVLTPRKPIDYTQFREACYVIMWGLFQKVLIADNLAGYVDQVFRSPGPYAGSRVLLAVYAFAFQIYGDFAGYSNMARGIAKLLGFDLMVNFNFPYVSRNPKEFWQRWHISLSTWLRDYLYIPLGGNRGNTFMTYRNLMLTMLLGGIWHGAAWTFVVWGLYQGLALVVHRVLSPFIKLGRMLSIILMFHTACLGWLVFRVASMSQAWAMLKSIFMNFDAPALGLTTLLMNGLIILAMVLYEYPKCTQERENFWPLRLPTIPRWCFYIVIFHVSAVFIMQGAKQFIYFQF